MNLLGGIIFQLLVSYIPHQIFLASEFEINSESYTIVGIEPAHPWSDLGFGETEAAEVLLKRAREARLKHRFKYFPNIDPQFFINIENAKNESSALKSSVLVFKTKSPTQIIASLEFAVRGDLNQKLPSEIAFGLNFSDPVIGEILSLDINSHSKTEFIPILTKIFDHFGVMNQRVESADKRWYLPERFILTCFRQMAPFYTRLEFDLASHQILDDPRVAVLEISATRYQDDLTPRLLHRASGQNFHIDQGKKLVKTSLLPLCEKWEIYLPQNCKNKLGIISEHLAKTFSHGTVEVRALVRQVSPPKF